jgi:hypothetical protein
MDMELEYLDVMERYRTLKHYEVLLIVAALQY